MEKTHPAHQGDKAPNETIVAFRLSIDTMINSTKLLKPSCEVSLAHTNLQRAFSWLGKALGAFGSTSPYKESFNPASPNIEPTAEHTKRTFADRWDGMDHTAQVKDFRAVLSDLKVDFEQFYGHERLPIAGLWGQVYLQEAFLALEEASIWFGWELARIRDAAVAPIK